jgi:hypothetical protein
MKWPRLTAVLLVIVFRLLTESCLANGSISLLAKWCFDESEDVVAFDSVRHSCGTIYGEPSRDQGIIGMALRFDGKDDCVDCGPIVKPLDEFSVSLWLRLKDHESFTTVLAMCNGIGTQATDFAFAIQKRPQGNIRGFLSDGKSYCQVSSLVDVTDNVWHHVAFIVSDLELRLYIDGSLDAGGISPRTLDPQFDASFRMLIGNALPERGGESAFVGLLDEITFYNGPMEYSEIIEAFECANLPTQPQFLVPFLLTVGAFVLLVYVRFGAGFRTPGSLRLFLSKFGLVLIILSNVLLIFSIILGLTSYLNITRFLSSACYHLLLFAALVGISVRVLTERTFR